MDNIVKEAYAELKDTVSSEGMSITSATKSWSALQKYMNRIAELAGDASEDILNNHPALKDKVGGNINQLKQGNVQELYQMIKESVQSGNTANLKEYVNKTVNKAKESTSGSGGGGGIEQYLQKIPGGGEIVPQLTKMYQIAQEHGEEAEKITKETIHEIEDVLKRRVGEAQELAKKAKDKGTK